MSNEDLDGKFDAAMLQVQHVVELYLIRGGFTGPYDYQEEFEERAEALAKFQGEVQELVDLVREMRNLAKAIALPEIDAGTPTREEYYQYVEESEAAFRGPVERDELP